MSKFLVSVFATVKSHQQFDLIVDADSKEEAEKITPDMIDSGVDPDDEYEGIVWVENDSDYLESTTEAELTKLQSVEGIVYRIVDGKLKKVWK